MWKFGCFLLHLFVPPCTDHSTWPHIQESDVQVTCKLNISGIKACLYTCLNQEHSDSQSDKPVNLSGLKASRNANTDTDILKYTELLNEHFVYYILKRTEW